MAIALPTLRGSTQQILQGSSRTVSCMTQVAQFNNAMEQRWVMRPPLYAFSLPMSKLLGADKASWLAFFSDPEVLGKNGSTATITVNGTTYSNLSMSSDVLTASTKETLQYDQQAAFTQVKAANFSTYTPPSVGGTYPTLKFGFASAGSKNSQLPVYQSSRFRTQESVSPYGLQFNFPWFANGLTGFPSSYLRAWVLEYPLLDATDMATVEQYFLGKRGRYRVFDFVDPIDGATYSNVRFDMDDLTIRHIGPCLYATTVHLAQINS